MTSTRDALEPSTLPHQPETASLRPEEPTQHDSVTIRPEEPTQQNPVTIQPEEPTQPDLETNQPEDPKQPDSVIKQTETVSTPHVNDVGKCLTGKTNLWTLSAPEKLDIIDNHFVPGENFVFPKTEMNKCKRSFRHQWLTTYPWLVYSKEVDGGFCLPCVLFATKENLGVLVNTPFRRWTKVSDICGQHQQKNYHSDAQLKYDKFVTNQRQPEKNIESQISVQRQEVITQNREVIKSVSKCVEVCGKMGLALRGHRDDSTADPNSNKGIFHTLLQFRQDAGDTVLKTHFETCGKNATYTSKTVQNELINIMGEQIRDDIIDEIKKARFYSILCDEVTDCANIEQLTIVLRFVDESVNIREEFVQFCSTERITGEVIATTILSKLNDWGLDIEDCRGQGYDGASNMSSARVGVQGRLCGLNPLALYTHCCSHILNLVIVKACSIPMIRNMAGTITETAYFFQNSAKRQRMVEKVIDRTETDTDKKKLHDLCRTRWVERHEAYENFFSLYECIVNTMDAMLNERQHEADYGSWSWDRETLTKANGLIHALTNFEFIVSLVVTLKCLSVLKPVSVKLQKKSNDVMTAYSLVTETREELQGYRNSGEDTFADWFEVCKTLGDKVGVYPSVPRTAGRQSHRSNTPHDGPEEYYRRTAFIPFLDHLTSEMNHRYILFKTLVSSCIHRLICFKIIGL